MEMYYNILQFQLKARKWKLPSPSHEPHTNKLGGRAKEILVNLDWSTGEAKSSLVVMSNKKQKRVSLSSNVDEARIYSTRHTKAKPVKMKHLTKDSFVKIDSTWLQIHHRKFRMSPEMKTHQHDQSIKAPKVKSFLPQATRPNQLQIVGQFLVPIKTITLTILLCHLALLVLASDGYETNVASSSASNRASMDEPLSAIDAMMFSPTRRPPTSMIGASLLQNPTHRTGFISSKANPELESYLDDINHRELNSIAASEFMGDLLRPHAGGASLRLPSGSGNGTLEESQDHRDDEPSLIGSQSEQQIYSECALILQRTYVKNIDNPKHHIVPFGKTEQACISYKHIDQAIDRAMQKLKFVELAKSKKRQTEALELIHSTLEPPEDLIAAIGEINMATTQIIADQFDLSNDELLNGLPLIDMSKTKFWPICPLLVRQDIKCDLGRYRTFTGHCNNLKRPTWGAAMTPYARYLPPIHPDGIWIPRKSIVNEMSFELAGGLRELHVSSDIPASDPNQNLADEALDLAAAAAAAAASLANQARPSARHHYQESSAPGRPFVASRTPLVGAASSPSVQHERKARSLPLELPSPRLITSIVHRDIDLPNHDFSILFMSWGQLLDHDLSRAAQPPSTIKCCNQDEEEEGEEGVAQEEGRARHKLCMPIEVPAEDPLYGPFNVRCLEFRRSLAGVRPNCVLGPRVHQNAITAPIDANFVYGSSRSHADALRSFRGGQLRSRAWFKDEPHLKPLLPAQDQQPDQDCIARPKNLFCFLAGDVRANEQTHLTVLHTLYMREHNKIAHRLGELNPHWQDERLYQETRHIIAAGVQHVWLNEYVPLLIGPKMAHLYNLTLGQSYWRGYDPSVTTSVSNSFAAAAFRQGHTFVQGTVERFNRMHELVASEKLRNLFKRPFLIYQAGVLDELSLGMINQPAQSYDPFISEDIAGHLFQAPNGQVGHDLAAINLQRGRDQGLPGYNLWREWCGLPRAHSFDQLEPYLTNRTAYHYSRLYRHVDDIDLWSGGVSERKLPGAAVGPTFACIIARQFSNTRRGDRFWYENPGLPSSFTPEQLAQIKKVSLAKLICSNSDDLPTIQRWALRLAHPILNPRLACDQLPEMDLSYWQQSNEHDHDHDHDHSHLRPPPPPPHHHPHPHHPLHPIHHHSHHHHHHHHHQDDE